MRELPSQIPVELLLSLAPEELASKMLFLMRQRLRQPFDNQGMFMLSGFEAELWNYSPAINQTKYPREEQDDINLALSEAWAWLEAQGLLVPASEMNGKMGWRVLSRRARAMENQEEFANFKVARLLPKEILHAKIADRVWGAFMRGEFDSAVFQAVKGVEVAVRDASGLGDDLVGVKLMRAAFKPEDGPLTDPQAEGGEKQARMELFAGAMGSYKNPQSHRDVDLDNPQEALEIIYLANHLLSIVDARAKARSEA